MTEGFFAKLLGNRINLQEIRAEIRKIEREIQKAFDVDAFRSGDWFLDNLHRFVASYHDWDRIEELELSHPSKSEDELVDLLVEGSMRVSALAGGTAGAAVSAAELASFLTWGMTLTVGAASAMAEMLYLTNLQLRLSFDVAAINRIPISINDVEETLVVFGTALGMGNLDLHPAGSYSGLEFLGSAAAKRQIYKGIARKIGVVLLRNTAARYALPVLSIGIGAFSSRALTKRVGSSAKTRYGKLRQMKEQLFELRPQLHGKEKQALLAVVTYLHSDGPLTLEEIYLVRELARALQASAIWEQILGQQLCFSPATFLAYFQDPKQYEERETLLRLLKIVCDAKTEHNPKETDFLRKLMQS